MDQDDRIWVEIELEVGSTYSNYNCQIRREDYRRIEMGFFENPFIKVYQVHWYRLPDEDDDDGWKEKEKKSIIYGEGDYAEYGDEALLRIDKITSVFVLKHGPKPDLAGEA